MVNILNLKQLRGFVDGTIERKLYIVYKFQTYPVLKIVTSDTYGTSLTGLSLRWGGGGGGNLQNHKTITMVTIRRKITFKFLLTDYEHYLLNTDSRHYYKMLSGLQRAVHVKID